MLQTYHLYKSTEEVFPCHPIQILHVSKSMYEFWYLFGLLKPAQGEHQNLTLRQSGSSVCLSSESLHVQSSCQLVLLCPAQQRALHTLNIISLTGKKRVKKKKIRKVSFFPFKVLKSCTEPSSQNGLTTAIISLYIFKS